MDTRADDTETGQWMTYAELGQVRGISKESALKLALRQKWRKQKDNHKIVRVCVPVEWAAVRDKRADIRADDRADMSRAIKLLDSAVAVLKVELEAGNARFEAERSRSEALSLQIHEERVARVKAEAEVAQFRQQDQVRQGLGLVARLKQAWRPS
jgi:hypothetical protein